MASTFSSNKRLELPAYNDYVDSWNVPVNADMTVLDVALGGSTLLNATSPTGTVTLTYTQYRPLSIIVSGSMSADVFYTIPAGVGGQWTVTNGTTGAFSVYMVSAAGGASVKIQQGYTTIVSCDGSSTGMRLSTSSVLAAGSDTQVQYNSGGNLAGSSNLTFSGSALAVTGNISATGTISSGGGLVMPTGAMLEYGGSSAPTGWLLCNGAAVSRTTYAALFAVLGTVYGAGDGSTTFNVPNKVDRVGVGAGSSYARGAAGGAVSVTTSSAGSHNHTGAVTGTAISTAQMPSHNHNGTTDGVGDHSHGLPYPALAYLAGGEPGYERGGFFEPIGTIGNTNGAGAHAHNFTTNATGSNQSHDHGIYTDGTHTHSVSTIQPYLASNYIIKT
jgi:microcystin-dependent protein